MNEKLGMQLQVHEVLMNEPHGNFIDYRIQAADYPDVAYDDMYRMLGAVDHVDLDKANWALIGAEFIDNDYGWEFMRVVPAPKLKYIDTGLCNRCRSPHYLWSVEEVSSDLHEDLSDTHGKYRCMNCVRSVFHAQVGEDKRGYLSVQWRAMYRWLEEYGSDLVKSVRNKDIECAVCYAVIVDDLSDNRFVHVLVKNTQGNVVKVHNNCTFSCGHCDEVTARYSPWLYSPSSENRFHETYSVFNRDTCHTCYERFSNEYSLFQCDYCGSLHDSNNSRQFQRTEVCRSCYDSAGECDDCGNEYIGDNHYCEDSTATIHEYSYTPSLTFFKSQHTPDSDPSRNLYLGFELEVECEGDHTRAQTAKKALELLGGHRVYCKNDGSLDNGIEIVTHPHTLIAYQRDFNWSALGALANMGTRSWDTDSCGLHVHVSRKTFGICKDNPSPRNYNERISHMVRFSKLIYDNENMITQLAGRESEDYASFSSKSNLISKFKHGSDTRMQAVNNQPNVTLEVRVFKGSLRPERVLSALELVHAAVEYTRNLQVKPNSFTWVKFMGYLSDNVEKYPNLFTIMNELFREGNSRGGF